MGKFAKILDVTASLLEASADRRKKIDEITDQIVRKGYGRVSASEARIVAEILADNTESITWK